MPTNKFMKSKSVFHTLILGLTLLLLFAANSYGAVSAGYSEYYIPGDELNMWTVFDTLDDAGANTTMHAVISVTAWSDNTTLYYDHWEHCNGIPVGSPGCANGYNFDPDNPAATADEIVTFTNAGDLNAFESSNIPTAPRGTATYYDGGDRIYVAGGAVTVTRASWIEAVGVGNQSAAWEIYPVKPQLTTYILPFGENLGFNDFNRVFVLIQATEDNTTFQVDLNGDGTYDTLNQNRDVDKTDGEDTDTVTLQRGETFLLDRTSACLNGGTLCTSDPGNLNSGILIQGNKTLQVKFVAGNPGQNYCARGFSAFPRGFWTKDYYAPVDQPTGGAANTDYYLHNPNSSAITITWEALSSAGSFSIPAKSTISFRSASGGSVPVNSGIYFTGSDVFWGVGVGDAGSNAYEWGFSLLPSTMLYEEHFLGWAPGSIPIDGTGNPGNQDNDGVFLAVAQDNTRVWVDFNSDGTADQIDADGNGTPDSWYVTLDRLQTQFIYNPNTGDLSKAHFWATGPFTMSYGENADTATTSTPSLDLGYVAIPGTDFISLVLTVDKSVSPQVVPTASGSVATFTIKVNSHKYTVDSVAVTDYLPPDWQYVVGTDTTTITKPDLTTVTGASADPTITGTGPYTLSWSNAQVGGTMAENQEITIIFTARTTAELPVGTLSQNRVQAVGKRTLAPGETQTFTATDFAYAVSGDFTVAKASSAIDPLYPGDTFTYTVTVTNPASAASNQTGISVYDPLPAGISYVADSSQVTLPSSFNVLDQFGAVSYTNNNGTVNWSTDWAETDSYGTGPAGSGAGAAGGFVWITGGQLQFRYALSYVRDEFGSANYNLDYGSDNWASDWCESGDGAGCGSPTGGTILYDAGRLRFAPGSAANDAISRTATVTGASSATLNFTVTDGGIDYNETLIAEYSRDGGGYVTLGIFNGWGGWNTSPPYTVPLSGNNTLTLRFRVGGSQAPYDNNDNAYVDNVEISYNSPVDASGTQVQRTADLTGATGAALSFTSAGANLEAGDIMVIEASSSAAGPFTTLATATGNAAFSPAGPYDLTSYISANTTIRFRITGGYNDTNKTRSIDNVDISFSGAFTFPAGSAPNFVSSSSGYSLTPGQQMTLTYNVTVDDPLAAGIDQITNTAYANSNEIILPISASVINIVVNPSAASAEVGDRVWLDADGDGVQDAGEPGLANVEVTLKDQYGTPLMTTITDSTGHYLFTGVEPDNDYYVEVTLGTLPSGLTQSAPGGHTDNLTDPFDTIDTISLGNNRDQFGSIAFTNNDGTLNWATAWAESDAGGSGANAGYIRVTIGGQLSINNLSSAATQSIARGYDLTGTGATAATLTFDYSTSNTLGAPDVIYAQYRINGGTWTTFTGGTFSGNVSGSASFSIPIASPANLTEIRFAITSTGAFTDADEFFYVDNVNVEYYAPTTINNYLDADLGYTSDALTAIVGTFVWSDANSNGLRDTGEAGLAGVTVQLCYDADSDGILDTGEQTGCSTTTTAADGSYLFTGVTADSARDYFVYIDETQTTLSGYSRTVPAPLTDPVYLPNLVAGSSYLYANYGYHSASTYFIKDRVWFDNGASGGTANDGILNGGEPGIALVTVSLLDSSLNVVATTTTDANGDFTFSGLTGGGADYTIMITDTGGKLIDFYGTTASAISGTEQISNLVADVDDTAAPDFGYNLNKTIGTTAFNDLNGDGDQDSGELGFGGITVELYTDSGTLGVIDGSDAVIATLVTDVNGDYLFTGLNDGNYIVSIESPPSGYNYTGAGGNADSDSGTTGQQQAATITGGTSVLTMDFPYQASTPRSVSGTLWLDSNANGVINIGESNLAGVTLSLYGDSNTNSVYDPGVDTLVSSTTTASDGSYSFTGLPGGTYFVIITDDSGILSGYLTSFEETEQLTSPFNSQEVVDLSSSDESGINFGYYSLSVPTRVSLSDFRAYEQDGQVYVRWETAYEHNTLGFNLLRLDPATGRYAAVNSGLMPGIFKPQCGGIYTYRDAGAAPGGTYTYRLIEVENTGERLSYGPFTVSVGSKTDDSVSDETVISGPAGYVRMHKGEPGNQKARMQLKSMTLKSAGAVTKTTTESGDRIRITVTENGIYYLDAGDISSLLGIFRNKVSGMINNRQLSLSNQGRKVAYTPAQYNAGIYFYGTGIESMYTKENVYWLDKEKGTTMPVLRGRGPAPSPDVESFVETLHFEQDENPVQQLFNDPGADYWFWARLYASSFWTDPPIDLTFEAPGLSESQDTATIQLQLFGGSDAGVANDHHVKVNLNGVLIDEYWWTGLAPFTITFTAPLTAGMNTLTVTGIADPGVDASSVFIDSFDVTYHRLYEASGDRLAFKGDGNMPVTVGGFTSPDIMVFDVTDPFLPIINTATTVEPDTTGYMVSLNPVAASTRYFSVTGRTIQRVSGKAVVEASLSSRRNAADYIIIAPAGLISTAEVLAKHRRDQGYKTMVLDVEDIMNEFNYGISSPEAIKEFLSYAYSHWKTRPRYAVLAGDGSMDYKDNLGLGYGGSLIPSRMVQTPHGLFVSDNYLADFNGDYIPEISIGRLPVTTPDELLTVIKKIKTYERAPVNRNVVLVADAFDPEAGDFISESELLATVFPTGYTLQKIYLNNYNPATVNAAKSALVTAINNGAAFFNYVGHAGPNQLSNAYPGLINHYTNPAYYLDDVPLFVNSVLPVMTAMTCLVGNFSDPYQIILTEALVLKADSGIAAAWAPTGLSDDAEASILNREFYKAFLSGRNQAIGDVVRKALSAYQRQGTMPYMIDIYNILGDPALRMR